MAFKDVLNQIKSEAKDATEVAKLKTKISKEKTLVKDNYQKIGEIIYNRMKDDCTDEEIAELVSEISTAKDNIKSFNDEVDKVKMK